MAKIKKVTAVLAVIAVLAGFLGGFLYWTVSDLPNIKQLEEYAPLESSRVYSNDGKILAELYIERRTFVPSYQRIPHTGLPFFRKLLYWRRTLTDNTDSDRPERPLQ